MDNPDKEYDFARFEPYPYDDVCGQWYDYKPWKPMSIANGYMVEWDIPEPATLTLLALGGLAMLRRKRK